jgi:hypothetical protein
MTQARLQSAERFRLEEQRKAQRAWEKERRIVERMALVGPEYRPQAGPEPEQLTRRYMTPAAFELDRNRLGHFGGWQVQSISPAQGTQVWVVYGRGSRPPQVQHHVHAPAVPKLITCRYCAHRVSPGSRCAHCGAPL